MPNSSLWPVLLQLPPAWKRRAVHRIGPGKSRRDAARTFALSHEMGERRAETIWDAIALHATLSIGQFKGVDVVCTASGIGCDYGGFGYQELSDDDKTAILSAAFRDCR